MSSSSSFFSTTNPTPSEYENGVDLVAQATAQATSALASADAAATSAQTAQGYATSAGTSATTATQQASSASTSATNASNSATAAASSATAASGSATTASNAATNAQTSATNASNSATSAAASATSASTYATNAANSATAAANSASSAAATLASALVKTNNLSDLSNAVTARTNLGVAIGSNVQAWDADLDAIAAISSTSGLLKKTAANTWTLDTTSYLSGTVPIASGGTGATDAATARSNLGLGTAATAASTSFLQTANNLSDLTNTTTARSNLGLGSAALLASSAVLQSANNLSDLGSNATARTNLGLTALATTTPGTGVATALGVAVGTAGAFVVNGGALGTPSSGNLANCTFPTLNQNTTGTASNVTGTVAVANGGTGLTSLTAGRIPFGNGTSAFGSSANLFWDNTNAFLGVGISPSYSLHVSKSQNALTSTTIQNATSGAAAGAGFLLSGGTTNSSFQTILYDNSASPYAIMQAGPAVTALYLDVAQHIFRSAAGSERMRIDASGNVGIGTSSFGTSAAKVIGIANGTAPTTSPAGMGQLYVENGALKYRGSSGTVTTIANA